MRRKTKGVPVLVCPEDREPCTCNTKRYEGTLGCPKEAVKVRRNKCFKKDFASFA